MPKKLSILMLCSTLLVPNLGVVASSIAASAEPMRYWTVEELIEMSKEVEAEKNNLCHGDSSCERDFYEARRMADSRENNILDMFESSRVLITRVNPTKESVHLLFHDYDTMDRYYGDGSLSTLDEFNLVWLDPSLPDPRTDFSWVSQGHPAFVDQIRNNALEESVHLLLTKNSVSDGPDWLAYNREVEFLTNGQELSSNTTGTLHYAGVVGTWQPYGAYEYGECLNSPDYRPGMECRYVYYENYTRAYLPFSVEPEAVDEPTEEPAPVEEPNPIDGPISNEEPNPIEDSTPVEEPSSIDHSIPSEEPSSVDSPASSKETILVNRLADVNKIASETQNSTKAARVLTTSNISSLDTSDTPDNSNTTDAVVADNTSTNSHLENYTEAPLTASANNSSEEPQFPWWIIVFIFSGIALTLWWFVPAKKFEKKSC